MIISLLSHSSTSNAHWESIFFLVMFFIFLIFHVVLLHLLLVLILKATEEGLDPAKVLKLFHGTFFNYFFLKCAAHLLLEESFTMYSIALLHRFLEFVRDKLSSCMSHVHGTLTIRVSNLSISFILDKLLDDEQVAVLGSDMKRRVFVIDRLLIHILAFTNQNSNLIKVSFFARTPDVSETFLGGLIFGHIECQFVLGGAHSLELVSIGFPLEEHVDHTSVTVVSCVVEASPFPVILGVNVSTLL